MPVEMRNIFNTDAMSIATFLTMNGQGCYIPVYQRQYAWHEENLRRLRDDVLNGINQLPDRSDTTTFIGTIIAIHDTAYESIQPCYRRDVPPRVMTVIDGQQRLCTAIMFNIALHDYLRRRIAHAIITRTEGPHMVWIRDECAQLLADLRDTYVIERARGVGNYKCYPRIIRAIDDAWSVEAAQAQYNSPVARLIWEYIDHVESAEGSKFGFGPVDETGHRIQYYKLVSDAFRSIQRHIKQVCENPSRRADVEDCLLDNGALHLPEDIFSVEMSADVKTGLTREAETDNYETVARVVRAILFARYFNSRIAFTIVTATNEDDAFDMFEALNTTGEPLTAFETFKPKVIEAERIRDYENSPSRQFMKRIEDYLDKYQKADDRQRVTTDILVPFALAETGAKLPAKLHFQRRYLRTQYDSLADGDDLTRRRGFVESLADMTSFMQSTWGVAEPMARRFMPLAVEDDDALVGLEALKDLNHSITIAPMSRFYQKACQDPQNEALVAELISAVKATVAFSMLWRGSMGGTENIDGHYRNIMREEREVDGRTVAPLARRIDGTIREPALEDYIARLKAYLREEGEGIHEKEEWVRRIRTVGVYSSSRVVARFLLLCASDDAVAEEGAAGLVTRGRRGCAPLFTLRRWAELTVEHIAPQSESSRGSWSREIFEETRTIHTLGNLTLLPMMENVVVGDRSWPIKRMMYGCLCAETAEQFDERKRELEREGGELSATAEDVLNRSKYLPMCKSVALVDGEWSLEILESRTRRLAQLAWDRLAPWLDLVN